ncbi:hypothetical protein [Porphyrobacter sp. GA68]|uniref:hypothetical protein n=1 Tax=Porphyrobacter sp. GA68 TaxID=2883480 RepID=UPI001D19305C|nr:hypothetical protein [Porphyrobacter sp. GA68]
MAEIPLEKKGGMPGWVWLLLAVLLAGLLLWWLMAGNDRNNTTEVTRADPAVMGAPIEGAGAYAVGDAVNLDNAIINSVSGNRSFTVDASGQNMPVLFDAGQAPGTTGNDPGFVEGMVVNLDGTVRSASEQLPEGVTANQLGGADRYIYASNIEVVSRP